MAAQEEAAGIAALSICESLMIALVEKGLLSVEEARGTLEDAAGAHYGADVGAVPGRRQELAAQLIERLITQLNAVTQSVASGSGKDG